MTVFYDLVGIFRKILAALGRFRWLLLVNEISFLYQLMCFFVNQIIFIVKWLSWMFDMRTVQ